jgi:hypothetical protein
LNFDDSNFLQQQIFSVEGSFEKRGILHLAFQHLPNKILSNLIDELQNWKEVLGADEFEMWILMNDYQDLFFLFNYACNQDFDTDFLIEVLKNIKEMFFADDEEKFLSEIIFKVDDRWNNLTFFHYFCKISKNFELLRVLKWISASFGPENLKKLCLFKDDFTQNSIVFDYFSNERVPLSTCLEILNFFRVDLKLNETFLKNEIILKKNRANENILQLFFIRTENFVDFIEFVENKFKISDLELKSALTGFETLLFYVAQKSKENQEKLVNFLKNKFGGKILNELFSLKSLYEICYWKSDRFDDFAKSIFNYFDFVERHFDLDFLKNLICYKGYWNKTFLFPLHTKAVECLIKILTFLFAKFKNEKEFLKELLLSPDKDGNTFWIYYCLKSVIPSKIIEISKEFFELIKTNFDSELAKEFLLIKNKKNQNFHQVSLAAGHFDKKNSLEILENLLEVFGKDKEFFMKLTKQKKFPEEIKEFLETKLEIKKKNCILM